MERISALELRKFVLSADWHLVQTRPAARLDPDWIETQRQAVRFLVSQAIRYNCPLVAVGDIFDHPKVGTEVVNMVIEELNALRAQGQEVYLLAGNHDLEGHSAGNIPKCSIGTLLSIFPKIPSVPGIQSADHFGEDVDDGSPVLFTHQLIFEDEASRPPMAKGLTASELLAKYPSAKWIFTGDYHHSFHYQEDGRHVVNPGNLIAHNASMIEVDAICAFVDMDADRVKWIKVSDDPAMLTRDHLDTKIAKDDRLSSFLERVREAGTHSLTFRDKLDARMGLQDITEAQAKAYLVVSKQATTEEK